MATQEGEEIERVPLFKSWTQWYIVVLLFLILLIFLFLLFTKTFAS